MEKLCIKYEDEIMEDLGIVIKDIGVHSIRKWAVSYIL